MKKILIFLTIILSIISTLSLNLSYLVMTRDILPRSIKYYKNNGFSNVNVRINFEVKLDGHFSIGYTAGGSKSDDWANKNLYVSMELLK